MSDPCPNRNFATSRLRLEQAPSSAVLPPAVVFGETPFAIRTFASGNLPSAAASNRKLVPWGPGPASLIVVVIHTSYGTYTSPVQTRRATTGSQFHLGVGSLLNTLAKNT